MQAVVKSLELGGQGLDVRLNSVKFFFVHLGIVYTLLVHLLKTRIEVFNEVNQLLLTPSYLLQPLLYRVHRIILEVRSQLILLPVELDNGAINLL